VFRASRSSLVPGVIDVVVTGRGGGCGNSRDGDWHTVMGTQAPHKMAKAGRQRTRREVSSSSCCCCCNRRRRRDAISSKINTRERRWWR